MNIFESIANLLKGGNNAKRVGSHISRGHGLERRNLYSVQAVCEQAISDFRGIRVLAAACADERGRDTGSLPADPVCRESQALIAAAKKTGCFLDAKEVPGTRYTIRTGESEVRLVQREGLYYKIKNPFAKLHLKRHPAEYVLFEHVVHNILFPDCRMDFLGIAEDCHEARIVYRQKAVRSESRPDDNQIAEFLSQVGLQPCGRYEFGNDLLFVTDVGQDGDNVLLDDDGTIRFIDPIVGFRPPLLPRLEGALESTDVITALVNDLYCKCTM